MEDTTRHDAGVENHRMPHVQERVLQNRMRETEKNNLDNTSSVLGRLSLGPREEKDITNAINELTTVDPHEQELLYDPFEFLDDVTGQTLDKKMAVEARKLEMQFFRNMKVYDKVPRWMAARDGCKVITTKWRDINKGDQRNPNYRARLVGRKIKTDSRLDLFAATPPLESLRVICSTCASNQDRQDPYRIMSVDVRRAYFYAKATRPVYIEIHIEDFKPGDEGKVARLNLTLYGTRDAAQNWAKEYMMFVGECGFKTGLASPCNFEHVNRELKLTVHGDDFTVTGPTAGLQWMQRRLEQKYEIKAHYLGPESGMKDEIQILNRTLRWTKEGITYEADQRHAEFVIKEVNMKKANAVSTPTVPEPSEEANSRLSSPDMTKDEASRFRGLDARVIYLSLDRPDLQFAAKTASQHMAQPKVCQDQADREVPRQSIPGCPKVCVAGKTYTNHNVRRLRLGGKQDHQEIHQRRRHVLRQALDKVVEFNSTGHGAVERRGRALRYAQRSNPDQGAHLHDGGFWRKGSSYCVF